MRVLTIIMLSWILLITAGSAEDILFAPAVNYAVGLSPNSVFAADLDGDGDADLAVANEYSNNVSILNNNGDGTFAAAVNYGAGGRPQSVFAADLDGDGDADLAVANGDSNNVSILNNNGDGTFAAAVNYGAGGEPRSVFAADLDADGDADLAVANWNSDNVSILKNNGDGTFAAAVSYAAGSEVRTILSVCDVAVADVDGDGDSDLAAVVYCVDSTGTFQYPCVCIFPNNGDGTFVDPVSYDFLINSGVYFSIIAGDLDEDGDNDLVFTTLSDVIVIMKNNGTGNFNDSSIEGGFYEPLDLFAADLDGDGDNDLAVTDIGFGLVISENDSGYFNTYADYYALLGHVQNPYSIFAADFDGDGDADLAVAEGGGSVLILLNQTNPSYEPDSIPFALAVNYSTGQSPWSLFAADLDNDGDDDLAVPDDYFDRVAILENNGDGAFGEAVPYEVGDNPWSVFAADLDNDGDNDLAVPNWFDDNVSILKNDGSGSYGATANYAVGDEPHSIYAADLDGDGDIDLAVANNYSSDVSVLKNNGDGTFVTPVNYPAGDACVSVFAADLDNDGDYDLTVASFNIGQVSVLLNNGNGTFATAVYYSTGSGSRSVFAADLDGDGDNDLAVANDISDNISILLNNGNGTFGSAVNYSVSDGPWSVFAADLDEDGDRDLAVAAYDSDNVSILQNIGGGIFASMVFSYQAGDGPKCVFVADFDRDQDSDLAVANYLSGNVSILLNLTNNPSTVSDTLEITPQWLGFQTITGESPKIIDTVFITGPDSTEWSLSKAGSWLSTDKTSGIIPDMVIVTADTSGLDDGVYQGSISISAPAAANSPQVVDVSLHVEASVEVASDIVQPGESGVLPIYISQQTVSSFMIPLHYGDAVPLLTASIAPELKIDSVIISEHYRLLTNGEANAIVDTVGHNIIVYCPIQDPPIEGPDTLSLVALVYYSVPLDAVDQIVVFDTTTIDCAQYGITGFDGCYLHYTLPDGSIYIPNFEPGEVIIYTADLESEEQGWLDPYPSDSLVFVADTGLTQIISLSQIGDVCLEFTVVSTDSVVTVTPASGMTPVDLTVTPLDGLLPGTYTDTVIVSSLDALNTVRLPVAFEILSPIVDGDMNGDGVIDIFDFQLIRDYLHRDGPAPVDLEAADVTGDGVVDSEDMSCLARYLFSGGNPCVIGGTK